MAAADAAAALLQLVTASRAGEYLRDIYGTGVVYRAFATRDEAIAFAAEPVIDGQTTYSTARQALVCCGELAANAMATQPTADIVVVDIVAENERCTAATGHVPISQTISLQPAPASLVIEELPRPVDDNDATCQRVTDALERYFVLEGNATADDRRIYFTEANSPTLDDASTYDCIDADSFLERLTSLRRLSTDAGSNVPLSRTLRYIEELHASHDPRTSVIMWLQMNTEIDVVWLVARTAPEHAAEPADEPEAGSRKRKLRVIDSSNDKS